MGMSVSMSSTRQSLLGITLTMPMPEQQLKSLNYKQLQTSSVNFTVYDILGILWKVKDKVRVTYLSPEGTVTVLMFIFPPIKPVTYFLQ